MEGIRGGSHGRRYQRAALIKARSRVFGRKLDLGVAVALAVAFAVTPVAAQSPEPVVAVVGPRQSVSVSCYPFAIAVVVSTPVLVEAIDAISRQDGDRAGPLAPFDVCAWFLTAARLDADTDGDGIADAAEAANREHDLAWVRHIERADRRHSALIAQIHDARKAHHRQAAVRASQAIVRWAKKERSWAREHRPINECVARWRKSWLSFVGAESEYISPFGIPGSPGVKPGPGLPNGLPPVRGLPPMPRLISPGAFGMRQCLDDD